MNNREIDALVAEKVMGWRVSEHFASIPPIPAGVTLPDGRKGELPRFTTDMAAAWEVAEKAGMNWMNRGEYGWEVVIGHNRAVNESAPLAICLAALGITPET